MITPNKDSYEKIKFHYNSIPIFLQFKEDYYTPIALFEKLKPLKPNFLLESAGEHQENGRYSYIGLECKNLSRELNSLHDINSYLDNFRPFNEKRLPPFYNGFIGYMNYESVKALHSVNIKSKSVIPDFQVIFSKITIIIDHFNNQTSIVYNCNPSIESYEACYEKILIIKDLIDNNPLCNTFNPLDKSLVIQSNMTKEKYFDMVKNAQEYIKAGDIFQVVLSQKFDAKLEVPPFEIYKSVRRENPSPYLSYIEFNGFTAICSSPELLLKNSGEFIYTAPIAGTRAIKFDGKDHLRATELMNDQKELSEHLMLVDLGRNDIGKISKPGTVSVESFCQIKRFSKVMHLASSVKGELKKNATTLDALISTFPAGTVSGAPKIRAMEIIDELENSPRDLYAGSIFYINSNKNLNSCIAIRTIMITDKITIQSGGGIVLDSNPHDEYKETLNKAKALFNALEFLYKGGLEYDFNN